MQNSLIINVRRELGWHRRLFSDATTAALWGAWLWLCQPAIGAVALMCGTNLGAHFGRVAITCTPASLADSVLALAGTAGVLLLWKQIATRQARRPSLTTTPDYAAYFGLTAQALEQGRDTAVCVVHHDEHGRIVRIQRRAAATPAIAATASPDEMLLAAAA
jgi:poly-beta-1,6-N-acetyl-D-glucosamine biosynthesis protein PgaD